MIPMIIRVKFKILLDEFFVLFISLYTMTTDEQISPKNRDQVYRG